MKPGYLALSNGASFAGQFPLQCEKEVIGEVVFTTGMTGYIESLTDPSYAGQILTFTYPLIGNYGVPDRSHWESERIHVAGVILSEACINASHYAAVDTLLGWLQEQDVAVLCGVDTRAVTKTLRSAGAMIGAIAHQPVATLPPQMPTNLVSQVSPSKVERYDQPNAPTVVVVDCGMKANILRLLRRLPLSLVRVPYNYDFTTLSYDALFVSNGPGDPADCTETLPFIRHVIQKKQPVFGICLGAQLLALAAGATTYKLPFGHRGHNQPCRHKSSGRCFVTSQNHGYAIAADSLPEDWEVTFTNLNDGSVEGIAHKTHPFWAVQFHPEAAPGPTDTQWLFDQFAQEVAK